MQSRSSPSRSSLIIAFVLLTAGSTAAGVLVSRVRAPAGPLQTGVPGIGGPGAADDLEPGLLLGFPDAATLQARALAGELDCSRLPTEAELEGLQAALDRLNVLWDSTTTRLHDRMAVVVDELIARGELGPVSGELPARGEEAIGHRLTVRGGVAYEKTFYPGDDAQIDALQHRRAVLALFGDRVIRAAFE